MEGLKTPIKVLRVLAVLSIVASFGIIYWVYQGPDSVRGAARRLGTCLAKEDVECIMSFATPEELAQYDLTPAQAKKVVRDMLQLRRTRAKYDGGNQKVFAEATDSESPNPELGVASVVVPLKLHRGGETAWGTFVTRVDRKPVAPELITSMITSFITDEPTPAKADPKLAKILRMIRFAEQTGPALERIGARGIWRSDELRLMSFAEYAARYRRSVEGMPGGREQLALLNELN
ncbi:MAG: hypothetical protein JNJ45_09810 [Chthonomonas sp.]|nr:hypothetical protein [Chthonomonas sp.]